MKGFFRVINIVLLLVAILAAAVCGFFRYSVSIFPAEEYNEQILNNYGEGTNQPLSQPLMELQMTKITEAMRNQALWYGHAETVGCVLLQNGWMGKESHRAETMWLKSYIDWHIGTTTVRE